MSGPSIVIADDESSSRIVLEGYLVRHGFSVRLASDEAMALQLASEAGPDLIILGGMRRLLDGFDLCRRIRSEHAVPIIMLSPHGEEADRVAALDIGADDYLVKPVSPRELLARVRAVLRRTGGQGTQGSSNEGVIRFGSIEIGLSSRLVVLCGQPIELTRKEYELLAFLAGNPGRVYTREQLLDKVWDYQYPGEESTVTVHMRRLRVKVEECPSCPRHLKTVWGVGYKFVP